MCVCDSVRLCLAWDSSIYRSGRRRSSFVLGAVPHGRCGSGNVPSLDGATVWPLGLVGLVEARTKLKDYWQIVRRASRGPGGGATYTIQDDPGLCFHVSYRPRVRRVSSRQASWGDCVAPTLGRRRQCDDRARAPTAARPLGQCVARGHRTVRQRATARRLLEHPRALAFGRLRHRGVVPVDLEARRIAREHERALPAGGPPGDHLPQSRPNMDTSSKEQAYTCRATRAHAESRAGRVEVTNRPVEHNGVGVVEHHCRGGVLGLLTNNRKRRACEGHNRTRRACEGHNRMRRACEGHNRTRRACEGSCEWGHEGSSRGNSKRRAWECRHEVSAGPGCAQEGTRAQWASPGKRHGTKWLGGLDRARAGHGGGGGRAPAMRRR